MKSPMLTQTASHTLAHMKKQKNMCETCAVWTNLCAHIDYLYSVRFCWKGNWVFPKVLKLHTEYIVADASELDYKIENWL